MSFRKFTVLFLLLTLVFLSFASCSKKDEGEHEESIEPPVSKPCVITVDVELECAEESMAEVFNQLERNDTVIYLKDGDYRAENEQALSISGVDSTFRSVYVLVGDTLYVDMTHTYDGLTNAFKNKGAFSEENADKLLFDLCIFGNVKTSEFADSTTEEKDGLTLTAYTSPSLDGRIALEKAMIALLEGAGTNVNAKAAVMTLGMKDGEYQSAVLYCEYEIVISEKLCPVSMTVNLTFNYSESFDITVPEDVNSYNDADMSIYIEAPEE